MKILDLMKNYNKINLDYTKDTINISNITFLKSSNGYFCRNIIINAKLHLMVIHDDQFYIKEFYRTITDPDYYVLCISHDEIRNEDDTYLILKYGKILMENI